MSLPKDTGQRSLFDTEALFGDLFKNGEFRRFVVLRDTVFPHFEKHREKLEAMYCRDNGRPAYDPVFLAKVTLLQFMERLPDRQAAETVVLNSGWKLALGLDAGYTGFDPTTLAVFRRRLQEAGLTDFLSNVVLEALEDAGLVRKRSKQRLDSTHVIGSLARMGRLECVCETLRLALRSVPDDAMEDNAVAWEVLCDRYCGPRVDWKDQEKIPLPAKMVQAGEDAAELLAWWEQRSGQLPEEVNEQFALLQRVFEEQFELVEGSLKARKSTPSGGVVNPHDPEAQWSAKDPAKKTEWTGYKAQVAETVPEDGSVKKKGEPTEQFITAVVTTEATASDINGMGRLLEAERERDGTEPSELITDTGYISDDTLYEAELAGRELLGPARPAPKHPHDFTSDKFDVDTATRTAICPAGQESTQCATITEKTGKQYYRFKWGAKCDTCPLRDKCATNKSGRRVLSVGLYHDVLQARRREMKTDEFKERMRQRAAIEGTNSELKRMYGFGRSRYRGMLKTDFANQCAAAACNTARWLRLSLWRADQGAELCLCGSQ